MSKYLHLLVYITLVRAAEIYLSNWVQNIRKDSRNVRDTEVNNTSKQIYAIRSGGVTIGTLYSE